MGDPIQKTYGATDKRTTLFYFKPYELVIVGLDVPDDPDSPVSDPDRIALGIDEGRVRDIMAHGVRVPVSMRKRKGPGEDPDAPRSEVVAGRGRVMDAREAWDRMKAAGVPEADLPLVPAVATKGSDKDILSIMIVENLLRRQETVLSSARKAKRYLAVCLGEARAANDGGEPTKAQEKAARAETAAVCGINVKTLADWLAVLELHPGVQKLIEQKRVSAYVAVDLLDGVPYEQQPAKMKALIEENRARGNAADAEVEARRGGVDPESGAEEDAEPDAPEERPALPGRRLLRKFRDRFSEVVPKDMTFTRVQVGNLLDFVLAGKALKGPLRQVWTGATAPQKRASPA